MKTVKKFLFFFLVSLAIISCSKNNDDGDNNGENNNNSGTELFSAKVDGADFAADTNPASLIGGTISTSNGLTVLAGQGSTNDGTFINFQIIGYTGTGTYKTGDDISNPNMIMYGELQGTTAVGWASNSIVALSGAINPGTIEVTVETETMVEGTFTFEGYNADDTTVKNITQGQFKIVLDN